MAALAAATLLAGCGGDVTSLDPVARAASSSTAAQSFRFTFHASDGTSSGSIAGDGAYDADGKLLRMSFAVPVPAGTPTKLDVVTDGSDGAVLYLRVPFVAAFLPDGKSWLRVDLEKAASAQGIDLSQVLRVGQASPAELLSALVHSATSESLGRETVGGVTTTHYRTTVDPRDTLGAQLQGSARKQLEDALDRANVKTLPVEVWVGDDDLVRRLQVELPRVAAAGSTFDGGTFTEDLSGYGEPADVAVPPAADVFDATGKLA